MSDFVEECRREWKRLGVTDSIAEEMAAELTSDIRAAEADGVSVEELLGTSASNPHAFAGSWATERGIVAMSPIQANSRHRRLALMGFTGVAAVALIIAALLLATGEPKVSLVTSRARPPHLLGASASFVPPPGRVQASAAEPIEWVLLCLAIVALGFCVWLWSNRAAHASR
jgi:hypothetical protein